MSNYHKRMAKRALAVLLFFGGMYAFYIRLPLLSYSLLIGSIAVSLDDHWEHDA